MIRAWFDRLLARHGYWRWPEKNGHADTDAIARGKRWQAFYNEAGGLQDVLAELRRGYFEKAAQVRPGDVETLQALSLADRICGEIDNRFRIVIVEGEQAAKARDHADKIAELPEPMRRRL